MLRIPLPDPPLSDGTVRLRPWRHADAEDLSAAWNDPEVGRWNAVPDDRSVEAARRWIGGWAERRQTGLAIDLVIVAEDSSELVGEVGVTRFDGDHGSAELGFWLLEGARGRGYASSAVRLMAAWTVDTIGVRLLYTRVHPDNGASTRALERAGFVHRGRSAEGLDVWKFDPA